MQLKNVIPTRRKLLPLACLLALLAALILPANAATYTWTGGGTNTLFSNPENWGQAVNYPVSGDTAIFQWSGNQAVTFDAAATTSEVRFLGLMDNATAPTLTLDLGGFTYAAQSTGSTQILQPNGTNKPRTVILQNGTMNIAQNAWWGHPGVVGGANGEVVLRIQQGATLNTTHDSYLGWGHSNQNVTTTFHVEGGGVMNAAAIFSVGNGSTMEGNLFVTGPGSVVNKTGAPGNFTKFWIGNTDSTGNVTVTDGGKIQSTPVIAVGQTARGVGTLLVSGGHYDEVESEFTPSTLVGGTILIGGSSPSGGTSLLPGGMGYVSFLDGATGQFSTLNSYFNQNAYQNQQSEWVDTWGTLTIDAGHVGVTGTANLLAGSVTQLGIRDTAQDILMTVGNLVLSSTLELIIAGNFEPDLDDEIHLVQYTSLSGTFAGLSEGATIHQGNHSFTIHYGMGLDSNIIGLTVIPEPGTIGLLAGAMVGLALWRRIRG